MRTLRRVGWVHYVGVAVVVGAILTVVGVPRVEAGTQGQLVSGSVARWGTYFGTVGHRQKTPTAVPGLTDVVSVDASNASNYALQCVGGVSSCATDGTVWAWGDNNSGQLGDGGTADGQPFTVVQVKVPVPARVGIVAIGEARNEGFAIDATGQAYGWGINGTGSMCLGRNRGMQTTPVKIPGITKAISVQGGQDHVLFLLSNHTVVACGDNDFGQLGTGSTVNSPTPVPVVGLSNIAQITAGNVSSGAVDSSGNVYMWGHNNHGQIGNGSMGGSVKLPTKVNLPASAVEISAGGDDGANGQTFALLSNGAVYSWGDNAYGQLGNGNTTSSGSPVQVKLPSGVAGLQVATGGDHSFVLDRLGNVWGWGHGRYVGKGQGANALTAVKVDTGVDLISTTANDSVDHHGVE